MQDRMGPSNDLLRSINATSFNIVQFVWQLGQSCASSPQLNRCMVLMWALRVIWEFIVEPCMQYVANLKNTLWSWVVPSVKLPTVGLVIYDCNALIWLAGYKILRNFVETVCNKGHSRPHKLVQQCSFCELRIF